MTTPLAALTQISLSPCCTRTPKTSFVAGSKMRCVTGESKLTVILSAYCSRTTLSMASHIALPRPMFLSVPGPVSGMEMLMVPASGYSAPLNFLTASLPSYVVISASGKMLSQIHWGIFSVAAATALHSSSETPPSARAF